MTVKLYEVLKGRHENRKTTEVYLHSIGEMEREAIAVFKRAREKSHTNSHTATRQKKKGLRQYCS